MTIYYKDRAFYDADTPEQAPEARAPHYARTTRRAARRPQFRLHRVRRSGRFPTAPVRLPRMGRKRLGADTYRQKENAATGEV